MPFSSTRHMRQLPAIDSRSWKQKRGISAPAASQACSSVYSGGTSISLPSTMSLVIVLTSSVHAIRHRHCCICWCSPHQSSRLVVDPGRVVPAVVGHDRRPMPAAHAAGIARGSSVRGSAHCPSASAVGHQNLQLWQRKFLLSERHRLAPRVAPAYSATTSPAARVARSRHGGRSRLDAARVFQSCAFG